MIEILNQTLKVAQKTIRSIYVIILKLQGKFAESNTQFFAISRVFLFPYIKWRIGDIEKRP